MKQALALLSRYHLVAFIATILVILTLNRYISNINAPAQSTHLWRQSDCLSITQNYYRDGMKFFEPEIHNLHADNGTSGYAISECPYLYYSVAGLYNVFGYHYWVYRGLWSLIFIAGAVGLYLLALRITGSKFASGVLAVVLVSSPVITFYGNSFIPEVPALMFVIIGWAFFFRWRTSNRYVYLYLTALLFLMGGLLKITALISLVALACVWALELVGCRFGENRTKVFGEPWRAFVPFALCLTVVVAWYIWAWKYNSTHQTSYFLMRISAIWKNPNVTEHLVEVLHRVRVRWLPHLYSKAALVLFVAAAAYLVVFIKKANRLLLALTLLTLLGTTAYSALWFDYFFYHDYYFIHLYIFPLFLLLTSAELAFRQHHKYMASPVATIALLLICLPISYHTMRQTRTRYKGSDNHEYAQYADFLSVAPLMGDIGIGATDYIVSVPDPTPNFTLNILNRKGWTLLYDQAADSTGVVRCIERGAKFLVVGNYAETIAEREYLRAFTSDTVAQHNNLMIFRLTTTNNYE